MREGFEFIDTDHHVGPNMETLHKYASPALLDRWDELLPYYMKVTEGHHLSVAPIPYRRDLYTGTDDQQTAVGARGAQGPLGSAVKLNFDVKPVPEVNNENNRGRLDDMDTEGVDIALIFPSTFSTASTALDAGIQTELYAAYHRYLGDYCGIDTRPAEGRAGAQRPRPGVVGDRTGVAVRRAVGGRGLGDAARGPARRRPLARRDLVPDERRRPAAGAPLVLLRAALLPRLPRHLGQPGHRPHGRPPVGGPAPGGPM